MNGGMLREARHCSPISWRSIALWAGTFMPDQLQEHGDP